jgi:hypothetical protein
MSSPVLNKEEYERRKICLEELKTLTREQYDEVFRIIKRNEVEFTENSNGIFFDMLQISNETLRQLENIIELSKVQNKCEEVRTHELDVLRKETVQTKK